MNTPEVHSSTSASAVVIAAIIGLVVGAVSIYLLRGAKPLAEPQSAYIVHFAGAELTTGPQDRAKFITALGDTKVTFRLNMAIKDASGCSSQGLGNYNMPGVPSDNCTQPDMGQQVTQRVGFNNLSNLREALQYLK